jgi:hypothetical protein
VTDQPATPRSRTRPAVLKVLYLLAVTAAVFAVPAIEATRPARWWVVGGLLVLQAVVLIRCGVERREVLRPLGRLKWLFVVLLSVYAFLPGDDNRAVADWYAIPVFGRVLWVNLGGLALAALMCLQILTVLLASAVVRLTGPGTDLIVGLRSLGFPKLFVFPLDLVLAKLGGMRRPGGGGGGGGGGRRHASADPATPGFFAVLKQLMRGDVAAFTTAIRAALDDARRQVEEDAGEPLDPKFANDVAVIAGVGLVMVGFKMLKLLPGVPIASGHKTLLLFPLYILAARLTHTRWGGTAAGSVMGIVGFLQGDGRFGILEVLKHLAPGLLIDLMMPVVRRLPERAWVYCGVGLLAGVARLTTELAVLLLLGTRAEVYLFFAAKLVPTLVAGVLSGFVAVAILRAFPADRLPGEPVEEPVPTAEEPVAAVNKKEDG